MNRTAALVSLSCLVVPGSAVAQQPDSAAQAQAPDPIARLEAEVAQLPLYGPEDLRLDPERLQASRIIKRPRAEFLDTIFRADVQVIVSLERSIETDFTPQGPQFMREGFWVRWRANTHNRIDEAWIDLETLGLRRTVSGYRTVGWFEPGRVVTASLSPDSVGRTVTPVVSGSFYWNVTLPYVFAAMDVPAGTSFRLRGFSHSSKRVYPIRVDVVGDTIFTDAAGQSRPVLQVESRDPNTWVTWYVDRRRPPHYIGSIWRTVDAHGDVIDAIDEHPVAWHIYDRDVHGNRIR